MHLERDGVRLSGVNELPILKAGRQEGRLGGFYRQDLPLLVTKSY